MQHRPGKAGGPTADRQDNRSTRHSRHLRRDRSCRSTGGGGARAGRAATCDHPAFASATAFDATRRHSRHRASPCTSAVQSQCHLHRLPRASRERVPAAHGGAMHEVSRRSHAGGPRQLARQDVLSEVSRLPARLGSRQSRDRLPDVSCRAARQPSRDQRTHGAMHRVPCSTWREGRSSHCGVQHVSRPAHRSRRRRREELPRLPSATHDREASSRALRDLPHRRRGRDSRVDAPHQGGPVCRSRSVRAMPRHARVREDGSAQLPRLPQRQAVAVGTCGVHRLSRSTRREVAAERRDVQELSCGQTRARRRQSTRASRLRELSPPARRERGTAEPLRDVSPGNRSELALARPRVHQLSSAAHRECPRPARLPELPLGAAQARHRRLQRLPHEARTRAEARACVLSRLSCDADRARAGDRDLRRPRTLHELSRQRGTQARGAASGVRDVSCRGIRIRTERPCNLHEVPRRPLGQATARGRALRVVPSRSHGDTARQARLPDLSSSTWPEWPGDETGVHAVSLQAAGHASGREARELS